MGGALPHHIIAHCDGRRTLGLQAKVQEEFGWSQMDYERQLEPILRVLDPAQYPGRVDPETVLLFESGADPCIQKPAKEGLRQALGQPERYVIGANHRKAFYTMTPLYLNWMRHRVWEFLERSLTGPAEAGGEEGSDSCAVQE